MLITLARRLQRLEQRTAAHRSTAPVVRPVDASPEQQAAVLAILLEVGALRYEDDGTLLRLGDDGGYSASAEVLCPQ